MKLQNLIYATMVACAFSACSNDDDPNIPDPAQELDATLTVAFNSVGSNGGGLRSLQTKGEGDNQFNKIGKIGIAVFNAGAMNGTVAENGLISYLVREKASNDIDTTACISAKSGSVKVLVVANPTDDMFTGKADYAGFLAAISTASIDKESLLMSSAARTVTLAKGRNTIAANAADVFKKDGKDNSGNVSSTDNIKVYRNVARIEVPKITVEPREGFGKGKTAKFTLHAIYASKVRSEVMVFGDASDWCRVVNTKADLIDGETIYNDKNNTYPNYIKKFTMDNVVNYGGDNSGYLDFNADKTMLFVYDNSSATTISKDNATRLVIRGTYEYTTDGGATAKSENAYWTTIINNDTPQGSDNFAAHNGVLRNVKYLVNVKITGPGSTSEDPDGNAASLTANIQVVDWGVVEHNPDID